MPKLKLKFKLPSYRVHKASGQAVVTLSGRDLYLGPYGTAESQENYERVIKEWLARHRCPPTNRGHDTDMVISRGLSINEVFLIYWAFVQQYYQKNGSSTSEVYSIKRAMKPLLELYGRQPLNTFGPLALKACRERMIEARLSRGVINKHISRVKRFFKWATENELVNPEVYHAIQTVAGLRRGRTPAPESNPVKPVPDELVNATLRHVNRYIAAMIKLQRLTGMRPCEVTIIRERDLDMSSTVWAFRPQFHKTEHHDCERVIYFGPQAQEILKPFLLDDPDLFIFSPVRVIAEHRAILRSKRNTPLTPSQRKRYPKKNPRKKPGECYTTCSYEHAIRTGCDKAFPVPAGLTEEQVSKWRREHRWAPNQLRHSAATRLRKEFGIEAARVILGHTSAAITEVYAELDRTKAAAIMAEIG